ncbi:hypothetical protein GJA_150 [Janthinobacterium agaricidamnosum NBRC 102515 = DSM 9628]|uniref:Uncharacterized protein n=1 Tax=Janthinobacterium agaricidamnosum NBRC 102515 = DSM 9628 TaxID=1349767 RepID=W0UYU7_9BURK|nr:hypothetical protein GJA_150 [Janthinobacterium agaricidamnosum NBRC 102515 = DSM 9628]
MLRMLGCNRQCAHGTLLSCECPPYLRRNAAIGSVEWQLTCLHL